MEIEAWFYPNMERREAELKCINSGDYLVRYSSKQNRYILTVNWLGQGKHFVIQENFHVSGLHMCHMLCIVHLLNCVV